MTCQELEVIADLSELRPEVLAFETRIKVKGFYHSMDAIKNGNFRSGKKHLGARQGHGFGGPVRR